MRPEICKNCGSNEIEERVDHYICPYCETKYPRTQSRPAPVIREIHYVPTYNQTAPQYERPVNNYDRNFGRRKINKWVSLLLCFFLGYFGAHKFYEGKIGTGLLYLCTVGLFGIGWMFDIFAILFKPNPYYVKK